MAGDESGPTKQWKKECGYGGMSSSHTSILVWWIGLKLGAMQIETERQIAQKGPANLNLLACKLNATHAFVEGNRWIQFEDPNGYSFESAVPQVGGQGMNQLAASSLFLECRQKIDRVQLGIAISERFANGASACETKSEFPGLSDKE